MDEKERNDKLHTEVRYAWLDSCSISIKTEWNLPTCQLEEIQVDLSLLSTEINTAKHKVGYRTSILCEDNPRKDWKIGQNSSK